MDTHQRTGQRLRFGAGGKDSAAQLKSRTPFFINQPTRILQALLLGCLLTVEWNLALASENPSDGSRIYNQGLRSSSEPITALVAGDVPILGTQFSCQSCHGRSGMGSQEGAYIVPPIAAQFLFVDSPQPKRPAYDEKSLAQVLRSGVTPSGRALDPLMPRFLFSDEEITSLTLYLRTLSPGNSPGVDNNVIHFATVITDDVPSEEREAVLTVLKTYAMEKNRKTRLNDQRLDRGYTPSSKLPTLFRKWQIDEWLLTGPSDSWPKQLETYYKKSPVFALVGGVSHNTWGPIGRFCEQQEIPCLLPSTDFQEAEPGDFYTLYYSKGLKQEASLITHHLETQQGKSILQVYCSDLAKHAANTLATKLAPMDIKVESVHFDCDHSPPLSLAERIAANPLQAAVLWLNGKQLDQVIPSVPSTMPLYLSSTLLNDDLSKLSIPNSGQVFLAHPFRLPSERDSALKRFKVWAILRHLEVTHPRLQAEAFFACLTINDAVKHIGRFFIRDYVLDMLDHAQGLAAYVPIYPQPSFGPGQRFLAKGGYIVPLRNGQIQSKDAHWIIP